MIRQRVHAGLKRAVAQGKQLSDFKSQQVWQGSSLVPGRRGHRVGRNTHCYWHTVFHPRIRGLMGLQVGGESVFKAIANTDVALEAERQAGADK